MNTEEFKRLLAERGEALYRDMPWRRDTRPYYVLVSELMLQQTQVPRVTPKFEAFIAQFPNEKSLAAATLSDVLIAWQGLGYNRRAKFLHEAAKKITANGSFPSTFDELVQLPGVGKNTAGAILVYSFNKPELFIETNVRTVYIHHFFANQVDIDDKQIIELVEQTIDYENPRRFYQALMDYGSFLKSQGVRNNSSSKQYKRQPTLKGSVREVRGQIIRTLSGGPCTTKELRTAVSADERFDRALNGLLADGLVAYIGNQLDLTK